MSLSRIIKDARKTPLSQRKRCVRCGALRDSGFAICLDCKVYSQEYQKRRRAEAGERGLCKECFIPITFPYKYCDVHRAMRTGYVKAARARKRECKRKHRST